jgi:hypothetical protein
MTPAEFGGEIVQPSINPRKLFIYPQGKDLLSLKTKKRYPKP